MTDLSNPQIRQFLEAMASSLTPETAVVNFAKTQAALDWQKLGPRLHLFFAEFCLYDAAPVSRRLRQQLYRRYPKASAQDNLQCSTKAKVTALAARFMNDLNAPEMRKRLVEIYDVVMEGRHMTAVTHAQPTDEVAAQRQRIRDFEAARRVLETESRAQRFLKSPVDFKVNRDGREIVVKRSTYVRYVHEVRSAEQLCAELNVSVVDLRKMMACGWRHAGNDFGVPELDDTGLAALQNKVTTLRNQFDEAARAARIGRLILPDATLHSSAFHHGMETTAPTRGGKDKQRVKAIKHVLGE